MRTWFSLASCVERPDRARLTGRGLVGLFGFVLFVAACGGQSAELSTVDAELDTSGPVIDLDSGAEEDPLDAALDDEDDIDGDIDDDVPVPVAAVPPAPAPETSPAQRQANQTMNLPNFDEETGRYALLPTPAEDLDDASNPANAVAPRAVAPAVTGPVFTIPVGPGGVIAGGAPAAQASSSAEPFVGRPLASDSVVTNDLTFAAGAALDAGASGVLPDDRVPESENAPEADVVTPFDLGDTVDVPPFGDLTDSPSVDTPDAASDDDANQPDQADQVDCELRPWGRGCPIPGDIFERDTDSSPEGEEGADDGVDDDGVDDDGVDDDGVDDDGVDDDGVDDDDGDTGVQVPQNVIDILLSDPDAEIPSNDDSPTAGDSGDDDDDDDDDDDAGSGDDSAEPIVNPAGG